MPKILSNIRFHALVAALVVVGVSPWLYASFGKGQPFESIVYSMILGALGGATGTFQRTKNLPTSNVAVDPQANLTAIIQTYASPILGAIFAAVMYFSLVSEIITSPVLPKFGSTEKEASAFVASIFSTRPMDTIQAAKLCVWAYMAGFAERLVPNMIDRIAVESK